MYPMSMVNHSDGPGSKFFYPDRVGSGQPSMPWAWVRKISPKNVKFYNFFFSDKKKSLRVGSKAGGPLIYHGSKVSSGQVGSRPISS